MDPKRVIPEIVGYFACLCMVSGLVSILVGASKIGGTLLHLLGGAAVMAFGIATLHFLTRR